MHYGLAILLVSVIAVQGVPWHFHHDEDDCDPPMMEDLQESSDEYPSKEAPKKEEPKKEEPKKEEPKKEEPKEEEPKEPEEEEDYYYPGDGYWEEGARKKRNEPSEKYTNENFPSMMARK